MQAGMVHALEECHRVLKAGGTLIDLRPDIGNFPVEVVLSSATLLAGTVDSSHSTANRHAADASIRQAVERGLFECEHDEVFEIVTDLDTVDDLREYGTLLNRSILPEQVIQQVTMLTADETDDFSIHVRCPMKIARYRKIG